ncbi:MAG TPA: hypothetical protein VG426_09850 [Candidatus Dormibacteraeota bacterium]|jgi:hypothetical protein|nr:hypothetical protein [Candidatus Dormibacteraeota bacterium]
MESGENKVERGAERRAMVRRSSFERRIGERRRPDRSENGRRVMFIPDRRNAERRIIDRRAAQQG